MMNIRVRCLNSGQFVAECVGLLYVLFAPNGNGHQKRALLDIVAASRQASGTSIPPIEPIELIDLQADCLRPESGVLLALLQERKP